MAKLIPDPFCHQDMVDSGMFVHFDLNNINSVCHLDQ